MKFPKVARTLDIRSTSPRSLVCVAKILKGIQYFNFSAIKVGMVYWLPIYLSYAQHLKPGSCLSFSVMAIYFCVLTSNPPNSTIYIKNFLRIKKKKLAEYRKNYFKKLKKGVTILEKLFLFLLSAAA